MGIFAESLWRALELIARADPAVLRIVATSLLTSLAAVLLASLVAIPGGVLSALAEFRGKRLLRHGLDALMALPTVVVGLVLYGLLSRRGLLGEFGLLYTPFAIVLGQTVLIVPLIWNLVLNTVDGADPRLGEACRALGANRWQQARIVAHECRHALVAAAIMGFGRALGEVGVAMMLGGNIEHYTRTMTTAIALETSKGEFALALALGIVLVVAALVINLALGALRGRR